MDRVAEHWNELQADYENESLRSQEDTTSFQDGVMKGRCVQLNLEKSRLIIFLAVPICLLMDIL